MRRFFADTPTAGLQYLGDTIDADFDASEAETITLDSPWNDFFGTDEYVAFDATVAQPISQPYFYDGELQVFKKDEDELQHAQAQIENLYWTMGHPEKNRVTNADQIRGFWTNPAYDSGQQATLRIPANDTEAVRFAVQNDNVSIGFGGELDWTDDAEYDAVQRNMAYDHIASVKNGRCGPEQGCQLHADDSDVSAHGTVSSLNDEIVQDAVRTKATEEGEYGDMNPSYSQGDWVSWGWSGGTAYGRINAVHTDDSVSVNGTKRDPTKKGEPVYKIDHWDEQDGAFGNTKIAYESNLNSASDPRKENTTADGLECQNCSYGPCSCGKHVALSVGSVVDAQHLSELDLTPPQSAQDAAQTALNYKDETDAMNSTGWSRAKQLATGVELSPSDISDGTDGMANWWARHEPHTVTSNGGSLKRDESVDRPDDNSWIAGKGWGGIPGMNWAQRMDEKIADIRETNDELAQPTDQQTTDYDLQAIEFDDDSSSSHKSSASQTIESMTLHEFIDEHDLSTDDVIDKLNIDVPESPSEFYDSEPSVDDLADEFTAVESLADSKESLEAEVEELNDELREHKVETFRDRAKRLSELVDRDVENLVEQFEDDELTIEAVNEKISVAEDAIGTEPTTVADNEEDGDTTLVADNDGTVSETDVDRTQGGRFNLSSHDI